MKSLDQSLIFLKYYLKKRFNMITIILNIKKYEATFECRSLESFNKWFLSSHDEKKLFSRNQQRLFIVWFKEQVKYKNCVNCSTWKEYESFLINRAIGMLKFVIYFVWSYYSSPDWFRMEWLDQIYKNGKIVVMQTITTCAPYCINRKKKY